MTCSQCGKRFSARACGPDHAAIFAWTEAERRRIRRRVGYALKAAHAWADLLPGAACPGPHEVGLRRALRAIDRATKAPRGKVKR